MRGGKSRARGRHKRHSGYGTNRVFESSGPEGKIRGNTNQLVEKYRAMARDAHLSGDQIVAENFAQHAEHYVRLASRLREQETQRHAQASGRHGGGGAHKPNGNATKQGPPKSRQRKPTAARSSKDARSAGEATTQG